MECIISVDAVDQGTMQVANQLHPHLRQLSARLCNDYGGMMEHLWIGLELCPGLADRRPPSAFRFQKRVSRINAAKSWGLPVAPGAVDPTNVGHFSVRPDYFKLARVPLESVAAYLLDAIYLDSIVLEKKSARLGGFDARAFRHDMLTYIDENWPSRKLT
jgi:hypothetical protein